MKKLESNILLLVN